ncbi:MAG: LytR/AlgR family response regulator transcription factor, partial [Coprococcus sp.]
INFSVSTFLSGEEMLIDIEDHGIYDLIYLDIELTRIDGIEAARVLRNSYPETMLIFISAHSQYYRDAFDVQPFQFLDKPLDNNVFFNILERAINHIMKYPQTISFSYNRIHYNVNIKEILYFESNKRIVKVICRNNIYEFYGKLSDIEAKLNEKSGVFLRIHKSYLVNINYIREVGTEFIIMVNDVRLGISLDKRRDVRRFYLDWMSDR